MKKKAVLFDLDGTLLNTLEDLAAAANYVLCSMGKPQRSVEEVRHFVGNGNRMLMKRALPEQDPDPALIEKAYTEFCAYYDEHNCCLSKPYPGMTELLTELKEQGIPIGIVSNKYQKAVEKLAEHYFPGLVDSAVGARDDMPSKPDPAMIDCCLEQLGITREEAVYVGDSEPDVQTARNAQLPMIGAAWGFRGRECLERLGIETVDTAEQLKIALQEYLEGKRV